MSTGIGCGISLTSTTRQSALCLRLSGNTGTFHCRYWSGDTFVARMDSKADRKNRVLVIHNLHFEPVKMTRPTVAKVSEAIKAFAAFNECETITIEKTNDKTRGKAIRGVEIGVIKLPFAENRLDVNIWTAA
jgi:hypothetical protein